jgi:hypothetical protein
MDFLMYKLIDDIRDYQIKYGKEPNIKLIKDWAENYADDEKELYYEKPCSKSLTYIILFSTYLLGVLSTLTFLHLLI